MENSAAVPFSIFRSGIRPLVSSEWPAQKPLGSSGCNSLILRDRNPRISMAQNQMILGTRPLLRSVKSQTANAKIVYVRQVNRIQGNSYLEKGLSLSLGTSSKKNDNYTRFVVSVDLSVAENSTVQPNISAIFRSLLRPEAWFAYWPRVLLLGVFLHDRPDC
jgi:hypothetical protein